MIWVSKCWWSGHCISYEWYELVNVDEVVTVSVMNDVIDVRD